MKMFYNSCLYGDMHNVRSCIKKGSNDWDFGMIYACLGGHEDIVNLMIENGATNWNKGLEYSCLGGHEEIAKMMIKKGANDLNWGLRNACFGDNHAIIFLLIENGADRIDYLYDTNNLDLYKIFCERYPSNIDFNKLEKLIKKSHIYTILSYYHISKCTLNRIPIHLLHLLSKY